MNPRFALALTSLVFTAAVHAADMAPSELLQRHLAAFVRNDLDTVVSDYTSDSVLVAPDGTYTGPEQIRGFFRALMQHFPTGASTLQLDQTAFHGDLVYFTWHAKTPTLVVRFATDTMIVRGGKILTQTFAGMLEPLAH